MRVVGKLFGTYRRLQQGDVLHQPVVETSPVPLAKVAPGASSMIFALTSSTASSRKSCASCGDSGLALKAPCISMHGSGSVQQVWLKLRTVLRVLQLQGSSARQVLM